jgi:hypothetical protein
MIPLRIDGESPPTIEKVMINHILFTLALSDDADHFPIVMHYTKE